jgi:hypothetical protein
MKSVSETIPTAALIYIPLAMATSVPKTPPKSSLCDAVAVYLAMYYLWSRRSSSRQRKVADIDAQSSKRETCFKRHRLRIGEKLISSSVLFPRRAGDDRPFTSWSDGATLHTFKVASSRCGRGSSKRKRFPHRQMVEAQLTVS